MVGGGYNPIFVAQPLGLSLQPDTVFSCSINLLNTHNLAHIVCCWYEFVYNTLCLTI